MPFLPACYLPTWITAFYCLPFLPAVTGSFWILLYLPAGIPFVYLPAATCLQFWMLRSALRITCR